MLDLATDKSPSQTSSCACAQTSGLQSRALTYIRCVHPLRVPMSWQSRDLTYFVDNSVCVRAGFVGGRGDGQDPRRAGQPEADGGHDGRAALGPWLAPGRVSDTSLDRCLVLATMHQACAIPSGSSSLVCLRMSAVCLDNHEQRRNTKVNTRATELKLTTVRCSVGRYAMWEKRTNWELGTRVRRHDTAGTWLAFFSRFQRPWVAFFSR